MTDRAKEGQAPGTADDRVRDFVAGVNLAYKAEVAQVGAKFGALRLKRFSSGILSLDCALGGGWPFGRIAIVAGDEATGKTLLGLRAAESVQNYDRATHLRRDLVSGDFDPGIALFVDLEGAFDLVWARLQGFDDEHHVVARPEYAEQAIDIVTDAVRGGVFDLIVVDSIAAMTPTKEIEESAEDMQVGLSARLMNKALRRWVGSLNKLSQQGKQGPLVLCLNQLRINIGQFIGDPRVLPGGRGQKFASSITIYTRSPKVLDGDDKEAATVQLGGVCKKNKTYVLGKNFAFEMALKDAGGLRAGQIDNAKQLRVAGARYGLIEKDGAAWRFGDVSEKTQKAIMRRILGDDSLRRRLWDGIVEKACA